MNVFKSFLVISTAIFFLTPVQSPTLSATRESRTPQRLEKSDRSYLRAELLFLEKKPDESMLVLDTFFKEDRKYSSIPTLVKALNLRGLIQFRLKNIHPAIKDFRQAVTIATKNMSASNPSLHLLRYNLAKAYYQNEEIERSKDILLTIEPRLLHSDVRIRLYNLIGNTFLKLKKYIPAITAFLLTANELEEKNPVTTRALTRKALAISKNIFLHNEKSDLKKLNAYKSKMRPNSTGIWALRLILSKGYAKIGERKEAKNILRAFLEHSSLRSHPLEKNARAMLSLLEKLSLVKPNRIGILLPISGQFAKYGQLSLSAALMALEQFKTVDSPPNETDITLVIRDSGPSPESALQAFEKLVTEDQVIAVVGPLLSKQAIPVAQKAQEYGVPLFSLSQKQGLKALGSYIFPIALTPQQQVSMLANYTMNVKNQRRFLILAPRNKIGKEYVRLFWSAVKENGGEIKGVEYYAPGSTDFRNEIKKLVGLYHLDARTLESDQIGDLKEQYIASFDEKKPSRHSLKKFTLGSIVDFDAIFVPDGPQVIGQVAPSFAVYDVKNIPFLGLNTWNTPDIIRRAGRFLQQAVFVDTFYTGTKNRAAMAFEKEFGEEFGRVPGTLEVQANDATRIIIQTLKKGGTKTRAGLKNQILDKSKYLGISGDYIFLENKVLRTAYLLGVTGKKITRIQAPTDL